MIDKDFKALVTRMVQGVITQGKPAMNNLDICVYNTSINGDGLMCAVGHGIGTDDYDPHFDSEEYTVTAVSEALDWELTCSQIGILNQIQNAHDMADRHDGAFVQSFRNQVAEIEEPEVQEALNEAV